MLSILLTESFFQCKYAHTPQQLWIADLYIVERKKKVNSKHILLVRKRKQTSIGFDDQMFIKIHSAT